MANIPNKSNGQVLNASELYKLAAYNMTPASSSSTSETQVMLVALAADQISTFAKYTANFDATCTDPSTGANTSVVFRLKLGPSGGPYVTKQTVTIAGGDHGTGSTSNGGGGVLQWIDTSEDYTSIVECQITVQTSHATSSGTVKSLIIEGV